MPALTWGQTRMKHRAVSLKQLNVSLCLSHNQQISMDSSVGCECTAGFSSVLSFVNTQACRGYGYPWIYTWIGLCPCVDIILRLSCGYIHGYYPGTPANIDWLLYLSVSVCCSYSSFARSFMPSSRISDIIITCNFEYKLIPLAIKCNLSSYKTTVPRSDDIFTQLDEEEEPELAAKRWKVSMTPLLAAIDHVIRQCPEKPA